MKQNFTHAKKRLCQNYNFYFIKFLFGYSYLKNSNGDKEIVDDKK